MMDFVEAEDSWLKIEEELKGRGVSFPLHLYGSLKMIFLNVHFHVLDDIVHARTSVLQHTTCIMFLN